MPDQVAARDKIVKAAEAEQKSQGSQPPPKP
jgi:hypothetical protein